MGRCQRRVSPVNALRVPDPFEFAWPEPLLHPPGDALKGRRRIPPATHGFAAAILSFSPQAVCDAPRPSADPSRRGGARMTEV